VRLIQYAHYPERPHDPSRFIAMSDQARPSAQVLIPGQVPVRVEGFVVRVMHNQRHVAAARQVPV